MRRLIPLVARNLGLSRSDVRRLIDAGRLVAAAPGAPLDDQDNEVIVDGDRIVLQQEAHLLLNKPAGTVTALTDARHPVAYQLLADAPLFAELRPAGRLDLDTTGLLLFSTDGALIQRLTHPKHAVPRTYHAALARPHKKPPPVFTLEDGHVPQVEALGPLAPADCHPSLLRSDEAKLYASITVIGGAYHEVRRIFAALDSHVLALCRVSYGPLVLPPDLAPGAFIEIPPPVLPRK